MQSDLPRLLFISPTYPDSAGNGLAMRAGMFIEALAQRYRITLLVLPVFGSRTPSSDALVRDYCAGEITVQPVGDSGILARLGQRTASHPSLLRLFERQAGACAAALGDTRFDVIHAHRLYTAPLAMALAGKSSGTHPKLQLDLDDVESATHAALAGLYHLNGRAEEAEEETVESLRYLAAEQSLLPCFDRVYVCSEPDAERIRPLTRSEVAVLPNSVRPPIALTGRLTTHPFTFLFIGTLGYYPNEDAVRYFCSDVLARIRWAAEVPFRIRIVGRGLPAGLLPLARIEEVRLPGEVADVSTEYAEADAVIVPIRAGGGTRIKVLEAFAHERPVVSTGVGIEGIEAEPGRDFLLADTPQAFAEQCLSLMQDAGLGRALVRHGRALLAERYSQQRINALVAGRP